MDEVFNSLDSLFASDYPDAYEDEYDEEDED
jgi:hypothetical protein